MTQIISNSRVQNSTRATNGRNVKPILLFVSFILLVNTFLGQTEAENDKLNGAMDIISENLLRYETKKTCLVVSNSENAKFNGENDNINIKVFYPVILSDKPNANKLNKRIHEILVEQVNTDTFRAKLDSFVKKNLEVYFVPYKDRYDDVEEYNYQTYDAVINNVNFDLFYSCESIVTLIAVYEYTMWHYYYGYSLHRYYEAFYFNVSNGDEFQLKDVFLPENTTTVEKIIKESISNSLINTEENKIVEDKGIPKLEVKKLLNFTLFGSGFFIPRPLSLDYYIPEWLQSCNVEFIGKSILIRLTKEQIEHYLNPSGPFALYQKPGNLKIESFNNKNKPTEEFYINKAECIDEIRSRILPLSNSHGIKRISISFPQERDSIQKGSDKQKIWEEAFYKINGYLEKIIMYDGKGKTNYEYNFSYDTNNNIIEFSFNEIGYEDRDSSGLSIWMYQYDKDNNLICKTQGSKKYFYSYFDNYYLEECYFSDGDDYNNYSSNKIYTKNKEINNDIFIQMKPANPYEIVSEYSDKGIPINLKYIGLVRGNIITEIHKKQEYDLQDNIIFSQSSSEPGYLRYNYNRNNLLIGKSQYSLPENLISKIIIKYNSEKLPVMVNFRGNSSYYDRIDLDKSKFYFISYEYW
ncbi:MAG: hypothetical protein K9I02_01680 [Haliscomenobacter sp.]|nr:hypothetical protein [Haliscomenobacter sp.]